MNYDVLLGVEFSILNAEQIANGSVVKVTESVAYDKNAPKPNGPADMRFGTCNRIVRCGTCKQGILECPTHPGCLEFDTPLPHIGFANSNVKCMNIYCIACSAFLMPHVIVPKHVNSSKQLMTFYSDESKKAKLRRKSPLMCPVCGLPQPIIKFNEPFFHLEFLEDALRYYFGDDVVADPRKKIVEIQHDSDDEDATSPLEKPPPSEDVAKRLAEYEKFKKTFIERTFTPWDAYNVLRSISADDLKRLNIDAAVTHPSGMFILNLVIPGIGVRPTMSFEEGSKRRGYHMLTRKLSEIIRLHRALREEAKTANYDLADQFNNDQMPLAVKQAYVNLYVVVSNYLFKDKTKIKQKMSQYAARAYARFKSVSHSLVGKHGLFRASMQGRRVDYCCRTVVTTNPDADIDELGFPRELAMRLTYPIRSNIHNNQNLQKLIAAGGVKQIRNDTTGEMIAITDSNRDKIVLLNGWTVERYLKDGDWIVMNRQPTLHRPSFMSYKIKIHDDYSLKLPPPSTIPFNADHDGDEMNGHVPQTLGARVETQEILHTVNHIMHPRANKPIMGLIQDSLVAAYLLTRQSSFFTKADAMRLLATMYYDRDCDPLLKLGDPKSRIGIPRLPHPAIEYPERLWTGKQLISQILPRVTMTRTLKNRNSSTGGADKWAFGDGHLVIYNGELLTGTLCKQTLGNTTNSIIHYTCTYIGNHAAGRLMSDAQRMLNRYICSQGFSIGVADCKCDATTQHKIDTIVKSSFSHISDIQEIARRIEHDPSLQMISEGKIRDALQTTLSLVGNVVRADVDDTNTFNLMSSIVGTKGSTFNLAQVVGLVGQTFVCNVRPGGVGNERVLPNEPLPESRKRKRNTDDELGSRGFVKIPFKKGLGFVQAFLNNMGGREGLVDTSTKVSGTGYAQRRLMKACEGMQATYDGRVRDTSGIMFQEFFGNDGLDSMKTLRVSLPSLLLGDAQLRDRCCFDDDDELALKELIVSRDKIRQCRCTSINPSMSHNVEATLPFDVSVIIFQTRAKCGCVSDLLEDNTINRKQVRDMLDVACNTLESEIPSMFTVYHMRDEFSSRRLTCHYRVCKNCALQSISTAVGMHRDARIQPGECVGALAATSCGEPMSQLTMNQFHFAGAGNDAVVQGVQRAKELIGASRNIATPSMILPLCPGISSEQANLIARCLPFTHLRRIVASIETIYEPDIATSHVKDDCPMVHLHGPFIEHIKDKTCPWVIRIVVSKPQAISRALEPWCIAELIQNQIEDKGIVISSRAEEKEWIIRVYFVNVDQMVDRTLAPKAPATPHHHTSGKKRKRNATDLSQIKPDLIINAPLHIYDKHVPSNSHSHRDVTTKIIVDSMREDLLKKLKICGIENILSARVIPTDKSIFHPDGRCETCEEMVISVQGCNLSECMRIAGIDHARIVTNDVMQIYDCLGITAASHMLFHELQSCLAGCGSHVDERLIKIIVDVMTHGGSIMPVSRHGLNRLDRYGVLAKAAFEETLEVLMDAAMFGQTDTLKGVSECIMVGRKAKMGTNLPEMMYMQQNGTLAPLPELEDDCLMSSTVAEPRVLCSIISEDIDVEDFEMQPEFCDRGLWSYSLLGLVGGTTINDAQLPPAPPCASDTPFRPSSPLITELVISKERHDYQTFRPSSPICVS